MNLLFWKSPSWGSRNNCIPCSVFYSSRMTFIPWSLWIIAIMGEERSSYSPALGIASSRGCEQFHLPSSLQGSSKNPTRRSTSQCTTEPHKRKPHDHLSQHLSRTLAKLTPTTNVSQTHSAAASSSPVLHLEAAGQAGTRSRQIWIYSSVTLGRWLNLPETQLPLL